jgi:hypothetical protein
MRRKAKKLILSVLLGVGIIQSIIGLLIGLGYSLSPQTRVYAAAGDLYCVTPSR